MMPDLDAGSIRINSALRKNPRAHISLVYGSFALPWRLNGANIKGMNNPSEYLPLTGQPVQNSHLSSLPGGGHQTHADPVNHRYFDPNPGSWSQSLARRTWALLPVEKMRQSALLVLMAITALGVLTVGFGTGESKAAGAANQPATKPLAARVQSLDRVAEEKSAWGSLRWVMNSKLDPGSGITLGIVELNAGQSNPLHVHPNSDEVIYMLSGRGEHQVGQETVILKAGDTLRIPAGTPHKAKALGNEPMRSVVAYNTGERQFILVAE